jgi:uncharacterized membrane protein YdbT with pleckstrin-like domain
VPSTQIDEGDMVRRHQLAFVTAVVTSIVTAVVTSVVTSIVTSIVTSVVTSVVIAFFTILARIYFRSSGHFIAAGNLRLTHVTGTTFGDRRFCFTTTCNNHQGRHKHYSKELYILHLIFPSKGLSRETVLRVKK